jgi:hypothetical protein
VKAQPGRRNGTVTGELADAEERDLILSMRMDAMLNSSPASFLSIVGGLVAVYVYWAPSVAFGLIAWLACIVAVALTNLLSTLLYARGLPSGWNARSWARFVCVMHLLSGLAWGVGFRPRCACRSKTSAWPSIWKNAAPRSRPPTANSRSKATPTR